MESPEGILDNLGLLLHPVCLERLPGFNPVAIRTRSNAGSAIDEVPQLGPGSPREVLQRTPGLVLPAVSELVRQHRQIVAAAVGKEHMVSQRNRAMTAGAQDYRP